MCTKTNTQTRSEVRQLGILIVSTCCSTKACSVAGQKLLYYDLAATWSPFRLGLDQTGRLGLGSRRLQLRWLGEFIGVPVPFPKYLYDIM